MRREDLMFMTDEAGVSIEPVDSSSEEFEAAEDAEFVDLNLLDRIRGLPPILENPESALIGRTRRDDFAGTKGTTSKPSAASSVVNLAKWSCSMSIAA